MHGSLYNKCELIFWDLAIDLLTRCGWLRTVIRQVVFVKNFPNLKVYLAAVVLSGLMGFFVGFSIPHFLQFLR